ncbi:MAG: hypothetical protein WC310_00020 [Patescibacteria group bacterium]|jgi:hypothetical protein
MTQDYQKLFHYLRSVSPREGFADEVILRLHSKRRILAIRQRIAIFGVAVSLSAVALVYAAKLFISGIYQTGFAQFFSLVFSDFGTVVLSWQSFAMTLLESLPILQLVALFVSVLLFLEFIRLLARDVRFISQSTI